MWLAYLVLAIGLLVTWTIRTSLKEAAEAEDLERFETEVMRSYAAMGSRVNHYLVAVQHLQGFLHAAGEVDEAKWKRWIPSMNWRWQYPNLLEIGFAERTGSNAPVVVLTATAGGPTNFPVGFQLAGDAALQVAMDRATLEAQTKSSGVRDYPGQGGKTEAAHVVVFPAYRGGYEPRTSERRGALRGFAFGVFRAGDLYTETAGAETNLLVKMEVKDVTDASAEAIRRFTNSAGTTLRQGSDCVRTEVNRALGRLWSLRFSSLPSFRTSSKQDVARVVLITGSALSLTFFAIAWVQATGRSRALLLGAEIKTLNADLENRIGERTRQLEAANLGLQQEVEDRKRGERVQHATFEMSEAVHSAGDLRSLYLRIHEIAGTLMPAKNFFLLLHDPSSDKHVYVHHVDEMDEWPIPRRITSGLVGYILRTGNALLVDRASMSDVRNEWHFVSGTPSEIWLGVPLVVGGQTIGVMAVQDYRNPKVYDETEKQILTFVAEQTALAIERKRSEAAVAASESLQRAADGRFRKAFHFSPALMVLTRFRDGKFIAANAAFLKASGYREDEVIGQLAGDLNIYARPEQRLEFRALPEAQGVVRDREHFLLTKDGGILTLLVSGEMTTIDGEAPCDDRGARHHGEEPGRAGDVAGLPGGEGTQRTQEPFRFDGVPRVPHAARDRHVGGRAAAALHGAVAGAEAGPASRGHPQRHAPDGRADGAGAPPWARRGGPFEGGVRTRPDRCALPQAARRILLRHERPLPGEAPGGCPPRPCRARRRGVAPAHFHQPDLQRVEILGGRLGGPLERPA